MPNAGQTRKTMQNKQTLGLILKEKSKLREKRNLKKSGSTNITRTNDKTRKTSFVNRLYDTARTVPQNRHRTAIGDLADKGRERKEKSDISHSMIARKIVPHKPIGTNNIP